jgi:FkbM family methyltransferase
VQLRSFTTFCKLFAGHPLVQRAPLAAVAKLVRWQVASRAWGGELVVPWIGGTRLLVTRGMSGVTGNIYGGMQEYAEMSFLLHFLRRGDSFGDIGANAGTFSVLAGGVVGAGVTALEPIVATYQRLVRNLEVNGLSSAVALNVAAGQAASQLRFTADLDAVNHALADDEAYAGKVATVPVRALDDIFEVAPVMLKIDVEGFEDAVLLGATRTLADPRLRAFIIEVLKDLPSARLGGQSVPSFLHQLGWVACSYDPARRALSLDQRAQLDGNLIFVRNVSEAQERLRSAPAFEVLGISL